MLGVQNNGDWPEVDTELMKDTYGSIILFSNMNIFTINI